MQFTDFMLQVTRPYWSPVHPSKYIIEIRLAENIRRRIGWGLCYPEDIGAFNLMWVMSGIGGPPDDYLRYQEGSRQICSIAHLPLGFCTLRNAAAAMPIGRFSRYLDVHGKGLTHLEPLKAALRLKV